MVQRCLLLRPLFRGQTAVSLCCSGWSAVRHQNPWVSVLLATLGFGFLLRSASGELFAQRFTSSTKSPNLRSLASYCHTCLWGPKMSHHSPSPLKGPAIQLLTRQGSSQISCILENRKGFRMNGCL